MGVKISRWLCILALSWSVAGTQAQTPPTFTRPGSIVVTEMKGAPVAVVEEKERPLKLEERLRPEVGFRTNLRSTVTLELSNGTVLKVGTGSEALVEEFWQQPHSRAGKTVEWREEPSPSRTRLRLVSGDATLTVKPLLAARGSSLTFDTVAGTVRMQDGVLFARIQMTELGLGLCTLELRAGAAEFERVGGATTPLRVGRKVLLAVEVEAGGKVRVTDAPAEAAK